MTYPAIHAKLKIAEQFALHTRSYLMAATGLAFTTDCPLSHRQALDQAWRDANTLWLHVGNLVPLFDQPADPPTD